MNAYVFEPQSLFVPYLCDVLARAGMQVVHAAATFDLEEIRASGAEALFVDTDLIDGDAVEAVNALRSMMPRALICAYTEGPRTRAEQLRVAGADCVLSKRSGPHEVADGLILGSARGVYLDPRFAGRSGTFEEAPRRAPREPGAQPAGRVGGIGSPTLVPSGEPRARGPRAPSR